MEWMNCLKVKEEEEWFSGGGEGFLYVLVLSAGREILVVVG